MASGTLLWCPEFGHTVSHVPGLNCQRCPRIIPRRGLTPRWSGPANSAAVGYPRRFAPRRPLTWIVRLHVESREQWSEGVEQRGELMRKQRSAVFVVIAVAILAPAHVAGAQQAGNMPRIGFLGP